MGFSVESSEKSSNLGYYLEELIHLDTDNKWQIRLISLVVYYLINNVTEKNNLEMIMVFIIELPFLQVHIK